MSFVTPSKRQLEYQDWEFGVFIHFGIRTFYEGHKDWDGKPMAPEPFNPTELDCNQWAETVKNAGGKYMVFTAKHHDGFANWPSEYTDFGVKSSLWKNGKGDVVKEFTDACRNHGLKVGIYYSPADGSSPDYGDEKAYDDYFINQVSELLDGRYGDIDMLWFDGCGSENHEYDWKRITKEIRRMQPNVLIFNMGDPDYRWVGNETGLTPLPNWSVVDSVNFSIMTDKKEKLATDDVWLPAECSLMMRDCNWFWSENDEHTVKTAEELLGIYYYTVGRGANMLLNIGPDRKGLLPEKDSKNVIEFGNKLQSRFANPIATLADFTQESETKWVWQAETERTPNEIKGSPIIDHVVLQENQTNGEHIGRFRISIMPYLRSKRPIVIFDGYTVGHKAICQFPCVRVTKVIVEIIESNGPCQFDDIKVFKS